MEWFVFIWFFVFGIAYLIFRYPLKNPKLTKKQRRDAFVLGFVTIIFQGILAFAAFGALKGLSNYDAPIITRISEVNEDERYHRLHGHISADSPLQESELGYAAYLEFTSLVGRDRGVRTSHGEGLLLELSDGTKLDIPELRYPTLEQTRGWREESVYRYLKPGDEFWMLGAVYSYDQPNENNVKHRVDNMVYMTIGNEEEYKATGWPEWGETLTPFYMAILGLYIVGMIASIFMFALRAVKRPPEAA